MELYIISIFGIPLGKYVNFTISFLFVKYRRKWKSLDRLNPPFNEELIANILISHYSEAAADTERTIYG